jgi:type I restriction enzyme S subunit
MSSCWVEVPLADIAKSVVRPIEVVAGQSYRTIGVKWWGEGAYERQTIDGSRTSAKTLSLVRERDLIINKIWVRHGSTAIASSNVDGCAASNEFPTFALDQTRIIPKWLHWQTKTRSFWTKCDALSRGTSGKNRIRPEVFLTIRVPLPPLSEQQRIVARIEELAAKINEARGLRNQAVEEVAAVASVATSSLLDEDGWRIQQLGELLTESPRNGLSPKPEIEDNGRPMLRINAVSSSPSRFVNLNAIKLVEVSAEEAAPFELSNDDVFIVRYNGDINRVAKPGIYKGKNISSIVYPDKLMRLRPDRSKMIPDFLVFALCSRHVREQISDIGKTTAGNIGISGGNVKSFRVPVPPLAEQHRIVSKLDALQTQLDALRKLQMDTAAELDALLPSILDQAFKGDL